MSSVVCLNIAFEWMWLRGLELTECATAIEVLGHAVDSTLVGANGNNVNDDYEAVECE